MARLLRSKRGSAAVAGLDSSAPGALAGSDNEGDSSVLLAELVDPNQPLPVGPPCRACGSPREGSSSFCVACGAPLESPSAAETPAGEGDGELPSHTFQCRNCGSEVATSVEQRSYVCPFCDSSYVTEIPPQPGRQRPEFIIGFAVTADQAREKYFQWLGRNSWLRPGDLPQKAIAEKQRGVYLPFWHFSMRTHSRWSARIGEYWYRTETYTTRDANGKTVTRTRRVQETEWFPLSGFYHRYYYGFLVPATRGISLDEARGIQPYQLTALARYRPYYLAGWMAEEYSISMEAAIETSQREFEKRLRREVQRFLPGDTSQSLSISTEYDVTGSDLILVPVHVLSYRYRDRVFRFLVNGQTGKVVGEKPWSTVKITVLVVVAVAILAALIILAVVVANQS